MKNADQSIHSITTYHMAHVGHDGGVSPARTEVTSGLTKREYFAGLAMGALIAQETDLQLCAANSVRLADALLEALDVR